MLFKLPTSTNILDNFHETYGHKNIWKLFFKHLLKNVFLLKIYVFIML